jgi:hypothetical protein
MVLSLRRPQAVSKDEGRGRGGEHGLVLRDARRAPQDEVLFSGRF